MTARELKILALIVPIDVRLAFIISFQAGNEALLAYTLAWHVALCGPEGN